jgi:hypothetical protein
MQDYGFRPLAGHPQGRKKLIPVNLPTEARARRGESPGFLQEFHGLGAAPMAPGSYSLRGESEVTVVVGGCVLPNVRRSALHLRRRATYHPSRNRNTPGYYFSIPNPAR